MNEQIRTLALQAGMNKMNQRSDGFYVVDEKVFENFALLIIKECIRIDIENPDARPGVEIARHFGIE